MKRIVVLTGAGISSESGIPTFRGEGGLWRTYRAEDLATPQAFRKDPKLVWEWYDWRRGICKNAEPNAGHLALARLEASGCEFTLITQNVDGLHARAGSRNVVELHGSIWRGFCVDCGKQIPLDVTPLEGIPPVCGCGGLIRPAVLWFGEMYDRGLLERAYGAMNSAGLVLVVGTSGAVTVPVDLARTAGQLGARIVEFNVEESGVTGFADEWIRGPSGSTLPAFVDRLLAEKEA